MNLKKVSDKELLERTQSLVHQEREILNKILYHLREIQRRRLYSELGYSSLFIYCTNALKYSESQAQRRIVAMRMIEEIPEIEEKVSNGDLSLSNIAQAKTFFNQEEKVRPMSPQKKREILGELENKTSREAEKILLSKATVPPNPVLERLRQITPDITEVKFAADNDLLDKMNRLKGLLAHKKPGLKTSELINELCNIALAKLEPTQKPVKKKMPKLIPPAPKVIRRQISNGVRAEVWKKADGKCEICNSTYALEIDHIRPWSLGGESEPGNLRLLCRSCNQRAAITKIGFDRMNKFLD